MDDNAANLFIIAIAIAAVSVIVLAWIKHRAPARGAAGGIEAKREIELLANENASLKGQIGRLEERLAVLERIATDPAERTARAIEQLR
jgi:hypothetical protein